MLGGLPAEIRQIRFILKGFIVISRIGHLQETISHRHMTIVNDVTSSLNAMHLSNTNERTAKDMEIDYPTASITEVDYEMDVNISEGKREMYEIYMDCCSNDAAKAMEVYLSIMSDVVGGHENAIAVLVGNMYDNDCFCVSLTRAELEKLVEIDNQRLRGIYPPYNPI